MPTPQDHPSAHIPADVTVVVVTHRGRELLPSCLDALDRQTARHALLVVDNGSADGTADYLATRLPAGSVLRLEVNRGFAGGVAAGLTGVMTRFAALINDDAVAEPDWLDLLLRQAAEEDISDIAAGDHPLPGATDGRAAAWTSMLVRADEPGIVQNAGGGLLRSGYGTDLLTGRPAPAHRASRRNRTDAGVEDIQDIQDIQDEMVGAPEVFGFCGGAVLLRTAAVTAVGGFPAEFFLYYEDTDLSFRLRSAGWVVRRVPGSRVAHAHSATSDQRSALFHRYNERNRLWFLVRNAPGPLTTGALLRFVVTTGSLAARRLLRQPAPPAPNLQIGLRVGVLREVAVALPRLLRERRTMRRRALVPATAIWREWAGRTD